ncbi:MAG TPA: serine protease [Candidatus Eisenbacteria bacterium]|jgi:S1-C subfamily serine protease|nr:serine protease [Candidatus Eisenbacteria bacterium]
MNLTFHEAKRPFFAKGAESTVEIRRLDKQEWGSGVIVTTEGLILTAYHVIGRARVMRVRRLRLSKKGWRLYPYGKYVADVIYRDKKADVAVLKLRKPPPDLVPATFGDSVPVKVGTPLFRIGRDQDGQHLAEGLVYALGRHERIPEISVSMHADGGASGGPVFDTDGKVIGLLLRGESDPKLPHRGFVIPINIVHNRLYWRKEIKEHLPSGLST